MRQTSRAIRFTSARGFLVAGLFATASCSGLATTHVPAEGALGPYSAAVRSGGFVFVSGKIGAKDTRAGEFAVEARAAIDAVEAELVRAGVTLADVVSSTVFLTDMGHYAALNEIYAQRFPKPHPARTCVAVSALPAGARIEIQVVARAR